MKKNAKIYFTKLKTESGNGPKGRTIAELSAKVANDIHEGYDGKESRKFLRDIISHLSIENGKLYSECHGLKTEIYFAGYAIAIMRELMKHRGQVSQRRANQIIKHADQVLDIIENLHDPVQPAQQAAQTNGR